MNIQDEENNLSKNKITIDTLGYQPYSATRL